VFTEEGLLYFTDPAYGMELRYQDPRREMDFTGVFMVRQDGEVTLLTDRLTAPNGIGLSPDESQLYVANSGGSSGPIWMVYELSGDGMPVSEQVFCDATMAQDTLRGGPDGLVVRSDGVIFATGPGGIWILNQDGEPLGIIRTGQATSNCTLDADEKYLYMTADMYLMRIRLL
jgi:gluconolactonase